MGKVTATPVLSWYAVLSSCTTIRYNGEEIKFAHAIRVQTSFCCCFVFCSKHLFVVVLFFVPNIFLSFCFLFQTSFCCCCCCFVPNIYLLLFCFLFRTSFCCCFVFCSEHLFVWFFVWFFCCCCKTDFRSRHKTRVSPRGLFPGMRSVKVNSSSACLTLTSLESRWATVLPGIEVRTGRHCSAVGY